MEIWLSPALGFDYANAKATIYGDELSKNQFITLGDVAQYAVESVSNPSAHNQIIELSQPNTYSLLKVVCTFEKVAGNPFELQFVPEAALAAQRPADKNPLQISFATLRLNIAHGIRVNTTLAARIFSFPLDTLEDYARRVRG